ncbi:calcium/calmodulin-regulated receptor-like kinase 2 [Chenopodium quinoa]|uniref:calcium/calmodulin-regulated receptor-like kinase 2 n=1 Tax=Chenopodium quinoa TaxID=63459 RepID=UPI000B777F93|nr:calcium/calmodulin-regulated receptor-like kinase 2 [Chenopodium quinoa]XP_021739373.1 calcium/calmodulin-regulated receptor-like kinase 2 [Chenopodium quinoa]
MVNKTELAIICSSAGVLLGIFISSVVFFCFRWYKRRSDFENLGISNRPIRKNGCGLGLDSSASMSESVVVPLPDLPAKSLPPLWLNHHNKDRTTSVSGIPKYLYKDIQKATQNFTNILGEGSFGPVYKATMPAGGVAAIKVLASNSRQGEKEFQTEVSLLGRLHHRNLVNLVGYCVDKGQYMLIYEYMSNGSLEKRLYSEDDTLTWDERLQIALDISHGIEYLHEGAVPPVVHRDLKSANILLDHSMRAKVADFGLSKEEVFDGRKSSLKGTYGYMDPAYISTSKSSLKSDIYSLGVIFFELITAIHPHQNLMDYVNLATMDPDGGVDEILDKRLIGKCSSEEAKSLAKIAFRCLHKTPRKRPSSGEISQAIVKIKQRRLPKVGTMSFAGDDLNRLTSMIEDQQVELSKILSQNEN